MSVTNDMRNAAKEAKQRQESIRLVLESQEWGWFLDYLKNRYVELMEQDCDSLRSLAARNAAIREIEGMFAHIGSEVKINNIAMERFAQLQIDIKDEPPAPDDENLQF